ncbi:MAG: cytochrome ubiquinol oxidase subunit I [Pseudomonadota bacterium]
MDTLELSRIQFAANITFHILFPAISIGLAWFLVYFRGRWLASDNKVWQRCYRFWVKVFALTFALGVVSGITMSFQFGTNWPGFMERAGNIAGPLLGYEVLTAFFLEATFLGIMLFGNNRVPSWVHWLATWVVAVGTTLSAFWIIALNSWMHTPAGYELRDGVFYARDWWQIVFNPSMPYRFVHVVIASALTAAFVVAGLSAYRLLHEDPKPAPRRALKTALLVAALLAPLQAFVGDLHGLNTFEHQPQKVAAMEGVWDTVDGAPLLLFALPNEDTRRNDYSVGIPSGASLILTHEVDGRIRGLNEFEDHPPVAPVFWAFRIMVGVGLLMWVVAWGALWLLRRRVAQTLVLRALVGMTFAGWVATISGWYVTEIGRQPWLVDGLLRTADAVTSQPAGNVLTTLVVYLGVYGFLLVAYVKTLFYLAGKSARLEKELYPVAPGAAPMGALV